MSVYKTREFSKFARRANLRGTELLRAADAVAPGQWDANLGGGVFKQRIAREGGGKSGGFRTIILFKVGDTAFSSKASPRTRRRTSRPRNSRR